MTPDLEFDLTEPGWRRAIDALPAGCDISAQRFFALLGTADEDEAIEAALALEQQGIGLDVSGLPRQNQGQAAARLQLEWELAQSGQLPGGLEPADPLRRYWLELKHLPALGQDDAVHALSADTDGVNHITEGLLYLVAEEAPAFAGQGVLLLDLMQEGALGLMQAVQTPAGDMIGQARWHIRQAMARTVAIQYLVSGGAARLLEAMRAYQQADRRLLQRLGRNPGIEELAQELGKTVSETLILGKMVTEAAKAPQAQPQEIPEEAPEAVEDSAYFQLRSRVEELLSLLDETDRTLLTLRFGLSGKAPQTQAEAACSLGITTEDAQRRELAAIARLREQ